LFLLQLESYECFRYSSNLLFDMVFAYGIQPFSKYGPYYLLHPCLHGFKAVHQTC
jgi:hypothetical protein